MPETYLVKDDVAVQLEIEMLFSQYGKTDVYLDMEPIVKGHEGNLTYMLKTGSQLSTKDLFINTLMKDVRSETNKLGVCVRLTGGMKTYEEEFTKTVNQEGKTHRFICDITFL